METGTILLKPYKEGKFVFTKKNNTVYAIYLAGENEVLMPEKILISSFQKKPSTKIYLLGYDKPLTPDKNNNAISIPVPEKLRNNPPGKHAWVFKITDH